jgi:phage-related baseplate assembly protein
MAEAFDFVETDSAKLYTALIGSLMDSVKEPLYPGDERRIFGEALVAVFVALYSEFNDKMKQRTLKYARGAVLDALGERYAVYRAEPAKAKAVFRFSAETARAGNIIIPTGTRITTDGSVYFATQQAAVLPAGSVYVDVAGECTEGGSNYNGFAAGTIATLVDLIPYITSVSNTTISAGGDDGEPYTPAGDDRFRERIRLSPATLSTAGPENAYRYFALSADPNIIDVAIDCPTEYPNVVNVYPLMKGGALPGADALAKVTAALSAGDVRPMTDKVTAIAPTQIAYSIEIKYYCTKDNEAVTIETIEGSGGAIEQYIAWQSAALSRDINPDQLRRLILAPATGVGAVRVEVTSPAFAELTKAQVAQLSGAPVVTHEIIPLEAAP